MGTHTLSLVFTPTDTTDFKAVTATTTVTVTQVTPTITWLPEPGHLRLRHYTVRRPA